MNWRTVAIGSVSLLISRYSSAIVYLAVREGSFRWPTCSNCSAIFIDFLWPRCSGRFSAFSSVNVPKAGNQNLLRGLRIRLGHAGNVLVTSSSVQALP